MSALAKARRQRVVAVEADREDAVHVPGGKGSRPSGRPPRATRHQQHHLKVAGREDTARTAQQPGKKGSLKSRPEGSVMTTAIEPVRPVTRDRAARFGT